MKMITSKERMMALEAEVKNIGTKLDQHIVEQRHDFDEIKQNIKESDLKRREDINNLYDKIDSKLENMEGLFAGKWVEKVIKGVLIGAGGAIIVTGFIFLIKNLRLIF
jgi:hypothetical protein